MATKARAQSTDLKPRGAAQPATRKIQPQQWIQFLDDFTRDNRGAHARLEVLGADDIGRVVETEGRPLYGIAADTKDGENTVWIIFGATAEDHLTHGIRNAMAIWLRPPSGPAGAVFEVEAKDGTKTLLELGRPEEYALPPGTPEDRRLQEDPRSPTG
jgi:hypothetical protein